MTIRVDLHVHAKVSKTIPFQMESFVRTVRQAMRTGLQGFALTEHFHSIDFWEAAAALVDRYPYGNGRLTITPGFHVLTGTELTVSDGADIIVVGPLDALARFDQKFDNRLSAGFFPRLADIFEPARECGLTLIGAHPTRDGKRLVDCGPALMARLNAIEINGKDVAQGLAKDDIHTLASDLGKPVVGSSDAHLWPQVGVQRTLIPYSELTLDGLQEAVYHGRTQPESTPGTRRLVQMCQTHKRLVKASIRVRERRHVRRPLRRAAPRLTVRTGAA